MSKEVIKNDKHRRIIELRTQLDRWAKLYYEENISEVSDFAYDAAYYELVDLEKKYPKFASKDSITQRVGGRVDKRFNKIKHELPMLSLSNAFDKDDLIKFDKQIKDLLHTEEDFAYNIEHKIDGLSIALHYEDGKLQKALTRGDGTTGEDVTHNVLTIEDIPQTIDYKEKFEARGEVYLKKSIFKKLNEEGLNLANPRNGASGSIRQLDPNIAKSRKLSAFIYSIPNAENMEFKTHVETLEFLEKNNFPVNKESKLANNIHEAIELIDKFTKEKDSYDFEIDGLVLKVNDIQKWKEIGFTAKSPKFMIAYKFPAEIATTKLEDIFPTVGRTGRITYNAKLSPVKLCGTTVSAATLHNADYIRETKISIGDVVRVYKAGEIIPKVLGPAEEKEATTWKEHTTCPSCGQELQRIDGEVDQYCVNNECRDIMLAKLEHFVSRKAMNIDGLSIQTLTKFFDKGLIIDFASIYELEKHKQDILDMKSFKEKSVNKLLNQIEKSKKNSLDQFLFGLGIRHLGKKMSKIIAKRFGTLENVRNASLESMVSIREIGEKASESVYNYFNDDQNKNLIERFLTLGLTLKELDAPKSELLKDMTFVITGKLSHSRGYYEDIIEANGGNASSSVTKATTYLLAGEKAGSKMEKAQKLNVQILSEEQFYKLLEGERDE